MSKWARNVKMSQKRQNGLGILQWVSNVTMGKKFQNELEMSKWVRKSESVKLSEASEWWQLITNSQKPNDNGDQLETSKYDHWLQSINNGPKPTNDVTSWEIAK